MTLPQSAMAKSLPPRTALLCIHFSLPRSTTTMPPRPTANPSSPSSSSFFLDPSFCNFLRSNHLNLIAIFLKDLNINRISEQTNSLSPPLTEPSTPLNFIKMESARVELRASVFEAIEEEDQATENEDGVPPALLGSCNDRAKQLHASPSGGVSDFVRLEEGM